MTWAAHYATARGRREWPNEELVRWIGDRQFGSILEVGCGNGANLWYLVEHADNVVGIDSSQAAVHQAREYVGHRRMHASIRIQLYDVMELPLRGDDDLGQFDLVVDSMVSQHLPFEAHQRLYYAYRQMLRPSGWFWLFHLDDRTASTRRNPLRFGDWGGLDLFPDVDLFCLPSPDELASCVIEAGFEIQSRRGLAREYDDGQVAHYAVLAAQRR